jgi:hypothetical protein
VTDTIPPGATAKTGDLCPQSGLWQVSGQPQVTTRIPEGHVMPPCHGKTVTWQFLGPARNP